MLETDHPIRSVVRGLRASLASVADVDPLWMRTSDKAAAMVDLAAVAAQLDELRLRLLATADDVADQAGARDQAAWLAHETRAGRGPCSADLRLARALDGLPALRAGLRTGVVSVSQARVIAHAVDDLPDGVGDEVRSRAEEALVAHAREFDPAALQRLGRRILDVVAPEVAEQAEARKLADLEAAAESRMRLGLRPLGDGTTRITGLLPDADAARLASYLHAFTNPRRTAGAAPGPETARTPVPYGHRAARAFCQLLEVLDPTRLPLHGGAGSTVVVTIPLASLREEIGTATVLGSVLDGAHDRMTAARARRLACTATVVPAVLGARSEVLDLGRGRRLFNRAQRLALLIRDRTCRAEGCDVPGSWTEAHHLLPWGRGGPTDLANSVLLCSHHHHRIHEPAFRHERLADGRIRFVRC